MRKPYIRPESCEAQAGILLALAASPANADGSIEGFEGNFTDIEW